MVRGFYAAAAGVFVQQKSLNVISNNIANASTAGFKTQSTMESTFGDHLVSRLSSMENVSKKNIGPGSFMTVNNSEFTDFSQGNFESTGRTVDMAINGEGFFVVESETYGEVLTRNGQFEIDADGDLVLPGVGKVLGEGGGTINLEDSDFTVDTTGTIRVGNDEVGKLFIAAKGEETVLKSVGEGLFKSEDSYDQQDTANYAVMQSALEKSNINMAKEMSKIIAGQNQYNSCTQILKIYDGINEITVNQIGRVG